MGDPSAIRSASGRQLLRLGLGAALRRDAHLDDRTRSEEGERRIRRGGEEVVELLAEEGDTIGAQMRPMAMALSDGTAIANVAAYISSMPATTVTGR